VDTDQKTDTPSISFRYCLHLNLEDVSTGQKSGNYMVSFTELDAGGKMADRAIRLMTMMLADRQAQLEALDVDSNTGSV